MGRKRKYFYFTSDTEDAIIEYNNCNDQERKNILYKNIIGPAFEKLIEILIRKYQFFYVAFNEMLLNTTEHLIEKMHFYDKSNGRAFSYFTIVARNYLIIENKARYSKKIRNKELTSRNYYSNINIEKITDEKDQSRIEFFDIFVEYLNSNYKRYFKKEEDLKIAITVLELIDKKDSIAIFNKKALFFMIKEMVRINNSQKISKVINIYKKIYRGAVAFYMENGYLDRKRNYLRRIEVYEQERKK